MDRSTQDCTLRQGDFREGAVDGRWTADGRHPGYSLEEMIQICRQAGYSGFWGIESSLGPPRTGERGRSSEENLSHDQIWANEVQV